jgi:hypothetical protein
MSGSWDQVSDDPRIGNFRILLVYANSPMDNLMPVSISSLSGALKRRGFDVKLFDTTFYSWTKDAGGERCGSLQVAQFNYGDVGVTFKQTDVYSDFIQLVTDYKPSLVALSTVEPTHLFGLDLLSRIRHLDIPTIVGGVHTIFSPDSVIAEPCVDMICLGEGEQCLVNLCEKMARGEDHTRTDGIWVKSGGIVHKNRYAPLIDLEKLPILDFSVYEEKRFYRPMAGKMYRMAPVEFSRGCVYNCTYCSAPGFAKKFKHLGKWLRNKPVPQIMKEIKEYVRRYDIEYFYFVSETFLAVSESRFKEFCDAYEEIAVPFWFNTRPETITKEKIRTLEKIGCHRMSVGVEAGNEGYRRTMLNRNVSNERIVEACKIVSDSSIQLSVNNIIGFPDETREMMFDTISLNRQIDADNYSCSIFQPYRGTVLYDYCVDKGYYDRNQLAYDLTVTSPLSQPFITRDEITGIARTFPLYIKFPAEDFDTIKKAERCDDEGDRVFDQLAAIYRERYEKRSS